MELKEALTKIQFDETLAKKFVDNPKKTLEEQGVNIAGLFIEPMPAVNPDEVQNKLHLCAEVCAYVGVPFVGCHKVGKVVGT